MKISKIQKLINTCKIMNFVDLTDGLVFYASFSESHNPEVGTYLRKRSGSFSIEYDNTLEKNVIYLDHACLLYDYSNLPCGNVPFSISLWIKIIDVYDDGSTALSWGTIPYQATVKAIQLNNNDDSLALNEWGNFINYYYQKNIWYHVVGLYPGNNENSKLYINSVQVNEGKIGWNKQSSVDNFGIGSPFWAGDYNEIYLSNVRIYDRALTENEITYIFNEGK